MKRNKIMKKILAMVMTAAMALTSAAPAAGIVITAEAATKAVSENLLVNPDFEETTAFSPAGGSHAGNWFVWQNASKTTDDAYSGKTKKRRQPHTKVHRLRKIHDFSYSVFVCYFHKHPLPSTL